jgi:CDP-paratose 2-epimerase
MGSRAETHPADIPYYVTDNTKVTTATGWTPRRSVEQTMDEIFSWLRENRSMLEGLLKQG